MPNDPRNSITTVGGTGFRGPAAFPEGVRNSIAFAFKIFPAQVGNQPGVVFDVTRQIEAKLWAGDLANRFPLVQSIAFPEHDERANDDASQDEESSVPNNSNFFYGMDAHGLRDDQPLPTQPDYRDQLNAYEYLRVRFDGGNLAGNVVAGSRSSFKLPWRSRLELKKDPITGKYVRFNRNEHRNEVGLNHRPLSD